MKQVKYERKEVVKKLFHSAALDAAIDNVHRAGMPGVFAEVRDGNQVWRGAAGVADVVSGRPVTVEMRHRVGSITKTFPLPQCYSKSRPVRSGWTRRSAATCRGWFLENAATRSRS